MTDKLRLVKTFFDGTISIIGKGQLGKMKSETSCGSSTMIGGRLCLDFLNTQIHKSKGKVDLLSTPEQLRHWLESAHLISPEAAERLLEEWQEDDGGKAALQQAVALRALLRPIMEALIADQPVPSASITGLNGVLHNHPTYSILMYEEEKGFTQEARLGANKSYDCIPAIARDAVDFLCFADHSLLKQCEGGTCIRLFYDTTKNHKRRWCSVEKCGRRAKAAAYYRRTKEAKSGRI